MEPALKDDFQFNVLVVDDDPTILSLMKDILSMVPGCNILTATEPAQAMKEIVQKSVDIIFTDIHMPNHSGLEFLQDLISLEQSPEVIVMSGHLGGDNAQKAMELGALSFIAKPFDDISVVEMELEKAIKRIIRQRAADKAAQLRKIEVEKRESAASIIAQTPEKPPAPRPLGESFAEALPTAEVMAPPFESMPSRPNPSPSVSAETPMPTRKVYDTSVLEALIEIEIERFKRYQKQFSVGYIDLPDDHLLTREEERQVNRKKQIARLERIVRRSDVLLDAGNDGIVVLAFECNKVGSDVLEQKLLSNEFNYSGFSIHPADGASASELLEKAKTRVQTKRKLQILLYEPDEFFGRLVQNMLIDPKYNTTWTRSLEETYKVVLDRSESIKLLVLSLSRDKEQWKSLAKMLQEGLIRWPIMLFVDVPMTKEVKVKLSKLGVRAIVNKSASHEAFMYLVQSFVIPKPFGKERKNYRALSALPVTYKRNGKFVETNTFTLSRDGLFVRDMDPPASGEVLDLDIFTPGPGGTMKTRVEVLYAVPYFVGVNRFHVSGFAAKFIDLTPIQRDQLEEIVSNSLTSYLL